MKKLKNKFKNTRVEYKIAVVSPIVLAVVCIATFIFAILPANAPVGSSISVDTKRLESAENFAKIAGWVIYVFSTIAIFFSLLGAYQEVKEKRQKSRAGKTDDEKPKATKAKKPKKQS